MICAEFQRWRILVSLTETFYTAAGLFPADRPDLMREFYGLGHLLPRKVRLIHQLCKRSLQSDGLALFPWRLSPRSWFLSCSRRTRVGRNFFMPGVYLAEADMYVAKCHVDSAKEALARFNEKFSPVRPAVEAYLNANPDPVSLFNAFVLGQSGQGQKLPEAAQCSHYRFRILRGVYGR